MNWVVLTVFIVVYAGMIVGRFPGLALDRTGVALLGAIALIAFKCESPKSAWEAVDVSTIGLLFGLMVVSAQFRLSGLYSIITRNIAGGAFRPDMLLALLILAAGVLSALLVNDVVCLAVAPLLVEGCARRGLRPLPFLLALACASNVGSAATLIGNPQNMLIGQTLHLSFSRYLFDAGVPAALGLVATWWIIRRSVHGQWYETTPIPVVETPVFSAWQTGKGLAVLAIVIALFLVTDWPREVIALAAAGVLLLSRRMHSRRMLGEVDWQLLVLFIGLFVVNDAVRAAGLLTRATQGIAATGIDMTHPGWLFGITVVLSNLVSNVPAVMLLLPSATHPLAGPILALSSTLAGNLFIVGSIANIIVVDQAGRLGIKISWRNHAAIGIPVTLATLAIAAGWLWLQR